MKKLSAFLLSAALILTLTACGKTSNDPNGVSNVSDLEHNDSAPQSASAENSGSESSVDSSVDAPAENGTLKLVSNDFRLFRGITCCTENGAYVMRYSSAHMDKELYGAFLTFVDYNSLQEVYVCADSACKHDNEHCSAFFSTEEFYFGASKGSFMFVFGDKLYYMSTPVYQDDSIHISSGGYQSPEEMEDEYYHRKTSLYRMNLDGTEREKVYTFNDGEITEHFAASDGESIWLISKTPDVIKGEASGVYYIHSKNRALVKLSVSEKSITERIPLDDIGNVFPRFEGIADDRFIFFGTAYADGGTALDDYNNTSYSYEFGAPLPDSMFERIKNSEYVFYELDRSTREIKEIYRRKHNNDSIQWKVSGDLVYIINDDRSGCTIDPQTHEQTAFSKAEDVLPFDPSDLAHELLGADIDGVAAASNDTVLLYKEAMEEGSSTTIGHEFFTVSVDDLKNGKTTLNKVKTADFRFD